MNELIEAALAGKRRPLARLITHVERGGAVGREIVSQIYDKTGRAHVIGVTGAPGSGKSTLVNELAKSFRQLEMKVAIIAVDPSSPFTGGALLGDRIRMRDLSGDSGVFIRSMASRGRLGGLAEATGAAVKLLDAVGYEIVLIETVGAGQAEVDIARTAHTTIVVEAPGMGDDIQSIKAGILEIADILVVNKADRPGVKSTVKSLNMMLGLRPHGVSMRHHGRILSLPEAQQDETAVYAGWRVQIQETVAHKGGGVPELRQRLIDHLAHLRESGEWVVRERQRSQQEIAQLLQIRFMDRLQDVVPVAERQALIEAVAARDVDPYQAADQLLMQMSHLSLVTED